MARLFRVCPAGVPQHVIQRGNNRQVCFASEQDFAAYAGWLNDYSRKFGQHKGPGSYYSIGCMT